MKKVAFGSGPQTPILKYARLPKPGGSTAYFRGHGFLLGLCAAVVFGFLFPQAGARNGALHPELIGDCGIALILFLQGLSIAIDKMRAGVANWRLHATIQAFTFVVFPLA
jgi:sodium/bile acid cotransporter 7